MEKNRPIRDQFPNKNRVLIVKNPRFSWFHEPPKNVGDSKINSRKLFDNTISFFYCWLYFPTSIVHNLDYLLTPSVLRVRETSIQFIIEVRKCFQQSKKLIFNILKRKIYILNTLPIKNWSQYNPSNCCFTSLYQPRRVRLCKKIFFSSQVCLGQVFFHL